MNKVDNKTRMLQELEKSKGIVSIAAARCGLSRTNHYKWYEQSVKYKKAVDDINEAAIDHVESKLLEKIDGVQVVGTDHKGLPVVYGIPPSDTAIIFYLKTKGKKRGYIEKQEIDHGDLPPTSIHITMDQVPPGMELPSSEDQVDLTKSQ